MRKPRSKLNNSDKTLDLIHLGEERVWLPSPFWIGVGAGIIVPDSLPVENPKAIGVGPWFGVYLCLRVIPMCTERFTNDTRGANVKPW